MTRDYYELLGVSSDVSAAEVHAAYRRLAKTVHPDVSGNSGLFILAREARDVLTDPVRRARYDSSRVASSAPNRPAGTTATRGPVVGDHMSPVGDHVRGTGEPWRPNRAAEDPDRHVETDDLSEGPFVPRPYPRPSFPVGDAVRRARPAARRVWIFLAGCALALPLRTVRGWAAIVLLWVFGPLIIRLVLGSFGRAGVAVGGFLASVLSLTVLTLLVVRAVVALRYRWKRL